MKDLMKLARECMQELDAIGIRYGSPISWSINTRAKKRWGYCKKTVDGFYIEISERLLRDNIPDYGAKNTIIHELLHTCQGAGNHQAEWQRLARMVNNHYDYNIQRKSNYEDKGVPVEAVQENIKYRFVCLDCGQRVHRMRASAFTRNYKNYRCGICGGEFEEEL